MTASPLFIALLAVVGGVMATALYLPIARRLAWLEAPVERSSHEVPTPSSGGLALVPALLLILGVVAPLSGSGLDQRAWLCLTAVALLCFLGAWDDRRSLSVRFRLVTQFVVCAVVLFAYDFFAGGWALALALLVGLVWLVNLYNFMDGIDGIAALQCALTAGALAVLGHLANAELAFQQSAAAVAGIYAGFLVFNWHPAKLFMGDAGSLSAGLLLGWLGLWSWRADSLPPASWLILMSPFLLDTGFTLLRRMANGEAISQAHKSHLYQRLARYWGAPKRVDLGLLLLHLAWLFPLALAASEGWANSWTLLAISLFPQIVLIAKWRTLE